MIKKIIRSKARAKKHLKIRNKISGTETAPRLCVFKSNKNIYAQIINDEKATTLVSASTLQDKVEGKNLEAAAKIGEIIANKAKEAGITKVVFDRSGYIYHGKVKALADAARENGLEF